MKTKELIGDIKVNRPAYLQIGVLYTITEDYLIQEVESKSYVGGIAETGWILYIGSTSRHDWLIFNTNSQIEFYKKENKIFMGKTDLSAIKGLSRLKENQDSTGVKLYSLEEINIVGLIAEFVW
jgi:hypothetical protein